MAIEKFLYRFAYYVRKKDSTKELRPYQIRDGAAFSEISSLLYKKGFNYGGIYLNKNILKNEPNEIDLSRFKEDDIIVLCTRPPLHDKDKGSKKKLERSYTNLEKEIFRFLSFFFEICTRDRVKLKKGVAQNFKMGFENRADIVYKQFYNTSISGINTNASYKRYRKLETLDWEDSSGIKRTAAYFIYSKEIWEKGPSLLVSFGMGGVETLAWNYLLKRRHMDLIKKNCFGMIEMTNLILPRNPLTLDFFNDWNSKIILKYNFLRLKNISAQNFFKP